MAGAPCISSNMFILYFHCSVISVDFLSNSALSQIRRNNKFPEVNQFFLSLPRRTQFPHYYWIVQTKVVFRITTISIRVDMAQTSAANTCHVTDKFSSFQTALKSFLCLDSLCHIFLTFCIPRSAFHGEMQV